MKKTTRYIFKLWLNDQTTRRQEVRTLDAFKLANKVTTEAFGWCSIIEQNWWYKYIDWQIIDEVSLSIEVLDFSGITVEQIHEHKELLKKLFNQEEVICYRDEVREI